ncbi:MAG: tRNA 2-thiouridine(34) synthase MnmA [Magnetococcales bacterium]|nr:tRNA 2-thiouridine(34) synthase MnmA [Magnetococcales bacterium]
MKQKQRVAVAMSGGVDSATVAALLLEQGYEVVGLTMALWSPSPGEPPPGSRACCAPEDAYDARRVADTLGIPFYMVDLEETFREEVVADFITAYASGRTPNPCVRCNQTVKFNHLLAKARALEATFLATGHYAIQEESRNGQPLLRRGRDRSKDQSYFLFATTLAQLGYLRFPLGDLTKEETRKLAERFGLHVADKRESQDICFIPDQDMAGFFARQSPHLLTPGEIVDQQGQALGSHRGVGLYTIGQRKGLGIAAPEPLYVTRIDPEQNRLVVGPASSLYRPSLEVMDLNWLGEHPPSAGDSVSVRIRYAAEPTPARLEPQADDALRVVFDTPQRAVTPGQACVFYQGDRVLGGGWIC